jgi:hexosaminidase
MIRLSFLIGILFVFQLCSQKGELLDAPAIIPAPQSLEMGSGMFKVDNQASLFSESDSIDLSIFIDQMKLLHSVDLTITTKKKTKQIRLIIDKSLLKQHSHYTVLVDEDLIVIKSRNSEGLFYGLQTLVQSIQKQEDQLVIPVMKVEDYARFSHRGLLLDCSRHFFEVDVIKKYIDLLAFYKMNVLHWHLTDDQGWRVEIDAYPKLTEVSAWRTELDGSRYGGLYTKDQIRELVAYAQKRQVTIIPEIELPGHSQAALAAYPELSCVGENIEVANDWGVFKEIYCAGNEETFTFLENVLTEVMELFPSEYIHIGGDEAPKYRWKHCTKCQLRIQTEALEDEHELQAYFIQRIEKFLNSNGRKLIGWDEIMEGGLSPSATVQAWRSIDFGIQAANAGNEVIFSPTSHSYLDYDLKAIDLAKVYSFNPISDALDNINGMEVNMWTEHVPDENTLDQKVFPRLMAMAEVAWTFDTTRNFNEFLPRVRSHYPLLASMRVNYGAEAYPVKIRRDTTTLDGIILEPGIAGLDLKYEFADSEWKDYTESIQISGNGKLIVQAFLNDRPYGEVVTQPVDFHIGIAGQLILKTEYSQWYTGGGQYALNDGLLGTLDFRDGRWQGYFGEHLSVTLDLAVEMPIDQVQINFYQYNNAWIFLPKSVKVESSSDGTNWSKPIFWKPKRNPKERGQFIESMSVKFEKETKARYIRVTGENLMKVPEWHEAAGSKAWLFVDEIIIR